MRIVEAFRRATPDGSWVRASTQCGLEEIMHAKNAGKENQKAYIRAVAGIREVVALVSNGDYSRATTTGEVHLKDLVDAGFGKFDTASRIRYQLSKAYRLLDKHELAEHHARNAIATHEKQGKRDHPHMIKVKRELFLILLETARTQQAREVVDECIEHHDALNSPHGSRADLHEILAEAEQQQGLFYNAHENLVVVCRNAYMRRLTTNNAPQVYAVTLGKLALLQSRFHNHTIAAQTYRKANSEVDSLLAPTTQVRAFVAHVEPQILRESGMVLEARTRREKIVTNKSDRRLWSVLHKLRLADDCLELSDAKSAKAIHDAVERDAVRFLIPYAHLLLVRARLQLLNGDNKACRETIRNAYATVDKPDFDAPRDFVEIMHGLARVAKSLGDKSLTLELLEHGAAAHKERCRQQHPELAEVLVAYADALKSAGRTDEAKRVAKTAKSAKEHLEKLRASMSNSIATITAQD